MILVLLLAFSLFVPAMADEPADMAGKLVILHTNDVHARVNDNLGYAAVAARKAELEAQGAAVLLLDAGDALHGKPVAVAFGGESIVDLMNATGYDAMAPGNHDFNYGYEALLSLSGEMDFPLLAANITYTDTGELVFQPNMTVTAGGYKIGIFGLATVETETKTNPNNVRGLSFAEGDALYACAQAQVDELLAEGCDIVIALGHLGVDAGSAPNRSTDVIGHVTGIDVFIDGHSHTEIDETIGTTLLASTGTELKNIGEIVYDGTSFTGTLNSTYEGRDETVKALAEQYVAQVADLYGETIGATSVLLNGERAPGNRTEETNLGDLATDAMIYAAEKANYDVDAAVTNGGGIRTSVPVGDITKYDLVNVFPFGNQVVVFDVPGSVLLSVLEANTMGTPDAAEGGFPQVSGMTYTIDTTKTENRVTIQTVGGAAFDPNATYSIATNDFLAVGGDKYAAFADYYKGVMSGINLEDAMIDYIQTALGGTVGAAYAAPQGRITVLTEAAVTEPEPEVPVETPSAEDTYTVVRGDSLWKIARICLGRGSRWGEIYALNRDVVGGNPGLIYPGQILKLPAA
ncbi:MAG TPA: 5'-nucleotidase C-terminal domain-containing protein [Oscillospiraceae bacterium]|nr:5'-nucleotidase C-terminal domain-containing protein [Oscillospiraceae bacterium]